MKMQLKITVPVLALAISGIAFAGSYFTLTEPVTLAGKKLKVGEYEVSLKKDVAWFTNPDGKTFSVPVKVEQAATKFGGTSVTTKPGNGSTEIAEIDLGGTTTRLIFGQ